MVESQPAVASSADDEKIPIELVDLRRALG
jgi:hypothetical protein